MEDLKQLIGQAKACDLCVDLPLGPLPIFKASRQAKILIVGQAPGRKTHLAGRPFDDVSGDRLRGWMGIDRETFYHDPRIGILPMGFCFPGTGKGGDLPPRTECAPAWRERFLAAMPDVELMLIIGKYARDYHLPERKSESVTATVSSWEALLPEMIATPHPSPRNMRWLKQNPWFEMDVIPVLQARIAKLLI